MTRKIIRGNVHIVQNTEGSIYEATEDDTKMRVNICQMAVWFDGGIPVIEQRVVTHDTNIAIFKRDQVLPGNILRAITDEQLTEDPEEGMIYDDTGIVCNVQGNPLYFYYYYSPNSKFQPKGDLSEDDKIEDYIEPIQ